MGRIPFNFNAKYILPNLRNQHIHSISSSHVFDHFLFWPQDSMENIFGAISSFLNAYSD